MIQVICCFSILSAPERAGAFSRGFTIILDPECRAFSRALTIEKLKVPLIPGPKGAMDTNDWCITSPTLWLEKKLHFLENRWAEQKKLYFSAFK